MKRFSWIVANAVDVSLTCNDHRSSYLTVAQELERNPEWYTGLDGPERAECVEKNQLCSLQIYPDTPVGSVVFQHADPVVCVDRAYKWLCLQRGVDPGGE